MSTPLRSSGLSALVVKFGAIGDVIMALPAAAALHAEGYSIDWVASQAVTPLLRLYPWIHVISVNEPQLLRGRATGRLAAAASLWRRLRERVRRNGSYSLIATLYYDSRYAWLTTGVPASRRIRLSRTDRRLALLPGRHHTDEYARILLAKPDTESPGQLAPVPPPGLDTLASPLSPGLRRVVLLPAGARNALRDDALRRWAIEQYVALADQLLRHGYEVVLAGGPEDVWASSFFRAVQTCGETQLHDRIGSTSLLQTLALLHSAAVTVTHDTGPLHMAGITSTAIVSIFGPTDPHGRLPHRANTVALWGGEGFACRPCYDGRDYAPCPHNGCMDQVTVEMVFDAVVRLADARDCGAELPPSVVLPRSSPWVEIRTGKP